MFTTVGLCAPLPFGSTDGEPEEAPEGAESVSTGDERNQGSCAEPEAGAGGGADVEAGAGADASGDWLTAGRRLGMGAAILDAFVFPGVNVGDVVIRGTGVRFVVWLVPSEPLSAWFVESTDDGLAAICGGALGNALTGMGSGIGGRGTRNAKGGFAPAGGVFFAGPFAPGIFAGVVVFPICTGSLEGNAGAGTAL